MASSADAHSRDDQNAAECPACGAQYWDPWRAPSADRAATSTGGSYRYLRCRDCGLGRIDPFPGTDDLARVFDDSYFVGGGAKGGYDDYDADADTHLANARHRLSGLARPRQHDGEHAPTLVDVGCATGYTLLAARETGYQAVGVEVSPAAAELARGKGFRVEAAFDDLLTDHPDGMAPNLRAAVDVVCLFQVLEHIPDPLHALQQAAELLRPGGVLLCETWDGAAPISRAFGDRWQQLSPPSVLWVFDKPSMQSLLTRAGLRLDTWQRTSKLVSVGLVAGQLAPRLPAALAKPISAAADKAGSVRLRYGLGDLVAVQATKR